MEGLENSGKRALVLAGGGIPGWMYEIGCLVALDDFMDGFSSLDFDIYVGTSAGAAVASLLANGVSPSVIFRDILNDAKSYFNFQRKNIYSFGYQETFRLFKRLVRSFFPILKYYFKNRKKMSVLDLLYLFQENLPSGWFTLRNFDLYLTKVFTEEGFTNDFRKLRKELYIPAVDLDSGRYDVFGEEGFDGVPISTAVTASSAMPIVFQPVSINGRDYIDGGVGRVAYMDIAMNHGAGLVLVVNPVQFILNDRKRVCIPSFAEKCAGLKQKGMSFIFDQAMRVNTNSRLYMAMRRYKAENPGRDFLLIQPSPFESFMFTQNVIGFKARLEVLRYGYNSTARTLKEEVDLYRSAFARHGIKVSLDRLKEI
jgi:predicted acylesterase/phospholipase RssA